MPDKNEKVDPAPALSLSGHVAARHMESARTLADDMGNVWRVPTDTPPRMGMIVAYQLVPGTGTGGCDTCPAIVTRVWTQTCVNLTVFPDFAPPFPVSSCARHTEGHSSTGRAWDYFKEPQT